MKRKFFKKTNYRGTATRNITARKKVRRFSFFNLLLAVVLWLALVVFFYSGRLLRPQTLVLGQKAPETIAASVDFRAENVAATQAGQRAATDAVLPVFSIDSSAIENARLLLTTNRLTEILPTDKQVDVQTILFTALSNTSSRGIISVSDAQTKFNGKAPSGKIALRGGKTDVIRTLDSFVQQADALKAATAEILHELPRESRNEEKTIRALIAPCLWPNLAYDAAETDMRRAQATALVDPVIEPVSAGTILVRNGDTVSEQTLKRLAAHEQRLSELETPAERIQRLAGNGFLLLIGLTLSAAIAGIVQPLLLRSRRQMLLLVTLCALPLIVGKGLLYATVDLHLIPATLLHFALPLSIAPLLASILLGSAPGLISGFWVSFALATLLGGNFDVFVLGLLTSVAAIYTTRDVKRRTALFRAGFWIGAVEIIFALVMAVLEHPSWQILIPQIGTAMLCGLVSALLALLLIPVFEHLFKITTDISLLELSDLSHPLLQSLAINAPGTYHHSLMLASLAQNAAEAVGANGLMLRVCAYFHDIGKLVKPGFFSENIQFSENPHDDLTPSMSTLVIVSHIKEGVMLAKKYKLPQVVIDGIEQHQGTSLVSVFYQRAKTRAAGQPAINDEDFRYEGPRPQTREMAILMLADSCEAASRSLEKPTPVRVTNLINDIFDARLRDGQLDECTLTLAELNKIKQSFVFSLTSMLHGRVAYPKDENRSNKPAETPDQPVGNPPADR
ncbi:MAG: HDIG domain-containing protein [Kiritimatiellaceae bacterium]|nr:HDIG domain-containing protein [Kiritimatiellaceae bacterium]